MRSLEYLAGVFDSEGSVGAYQSIVEGKMYGYYLQVSVTNSFKPVLDEFANRFGGRVYDNPSNTNKGTKRVYRWQIRSHPAYGFLKTILPYLWEKQPQAELALRFPNAPRYRRSNAEVREQQAEMAIELKRLKHA